MHLSQYDSPIYNITGATLFCTTVVYIFFKVKDNFDISCVHYPTVLETAASTKTKEKSAIRELSHWERS